MSTIPAGFQAREDGAKEGSGEREDKEQRGLNARRSRPSEEPVEPSRVSVRRLPPHRAHRLDFSPSQAFKILLESSNPHVVPSRHTEAAREKRESSRSHASKRHSFGPTISFHPALPTPLNNHHCTGSVPLRVVRRLAHLRTPRTASAPAPALPNSQAPLTSHPGTSFMISFSRSSAAYSLR